MQNLYFAYFRQVAVLVSAVCFVAILGGLMQWMIDVLMMSRMMVMIMVMGHCLSTSSRISI